MRITFEGDRLEGLVGEMRAFLAAVERPRVMAPAAAEGTLHGAALPACPVHLCEMDYRPAGVNRSNARNGTRPPYRCPRPDCRSVSWLE